MTALNSDYISAIAAHLGDESESSLSLAYDLGRKALAQGFGLLDVLALQDAVQRELVFPAPDSDRERIGAAVTNFLREFLSPFEMSFRGYREVNRDLKRLNQDLSAAYAELQAKQAQLIQSAKMASLGELVAGVAHEINNPLAFVVSHLATVNRSLEQVGQELMPATSPNVGKHWERALARLHEIDIGIERIRDLVIRLRTFSRLDEGEQKQVSIQECVTSVLTILGHRLKNRVRVETHFGMPDLVECFPSLLNQAIMNLVSNAIDAIEGQGTVTISTGADVDNYVIAVADTGVGIPEHLRERVLDPFFTTKPQGSGTGLGLSITYSIVQKHRGTLEIRQAEGGGTVITIRFPLKQRASATP
ncbi:MAG TPA: ATP-binding protein [Polyangiaceae bacterium]|nr:ATP-binding protein [Polyangiaceae bacterium]